MESTYQQYTVSRKHREPLLRFMLEALEKCGCRVINCSPPTVAPFKISFETADGDRAGILAYAFFANTKETKNRPLDEYRFQLKYGSKTGGVHELWQDPYGLYTTLLLGISPDEQFFVGYDPVLHSPTKHFISLEFKESFVGEIQKSGWARDERRTRVDLSGGRRAAGPEDPLEIIVGGRPESFLRYVWFEREACGEDQGHRGLLADNEGVIRRSANGLKTVTDVEPRYVHALAQEFELNEYDVLTLIAGAKRLKMAVRGWVAEHHLVQRLSEVEGVTDCERIEQEGGPDIRLRFEGSDLLTVECKNVLRDMRAGLPRVDFQRTRASVSDPCSRYYSPSDFNILAACLHAVTQRWEYSFTLTNRLNVHPKCKGKLSSNVVVDDRWNREVRGILGEAANRA